MSSPKDEKKKKSKKSNKSEASAAATSATEDRPKPKFDTTEVDGKLDKLRKQQDAWTQLSFKAKLALLKQTNDLVDKHASDVRSDSSISVFGLTSSFFRVLSTDTSGLTMLLRASN